MFVIYTFMAVMGALFVALDWLGVAPARLHPADGKEAADPPDQSRWWSLPLCFVGLVGVTLVLLDRPLISTVALSLTVGPTVGLVARWVSDRITGVESGAAHDSVSE